MIGFVRTQLWKLFRALLFTVLVLLGFKLQCSVLRTYFRTTELLFKQSGSGHSRSKYLEVPVAGSVLGIDICTGTTVEFGSRSRDSNPGHRDSVQHLIYSRHSTQSNLSTGNVGPDPSIHLACVHYIPRSMSRSRWLLASNPSM